MGPVFSKALGGNTDFLTSQSFIFTPPENPGQVLMVLLSANGEDAFGKIRKIGLAIEEFFYDPELQTQERFARFFQFLASELAELNDLRAGIVLLDGDTLYLEKVGSPKTLLKRDGRVTDLLAGLADRTMISGNLRAADRVLLLDFNQDPQFDWGQAIIKNLLGVPISDLEDEVENLLLKLPKAAPLSTVVLELPAQNSPALAGPEHDQAVGVWPTQPGPAQPRPDIGAVFKKIRPTKKQALLATVILLVAVSSLSGLIYHRRQEDRQFLRQLAQARQSYNRAQALKEADLAQAEAELKRAEAGVKKALAARPADRQAQELGRQIADGTVGILKIYRVENLPVFLDLSLVKKDFSASRMSLSLGKIAVLDEKNKTLVTVSTSQKNTRILAGAYQLGDARFASLNGPTAYVFSKDKGILGVDIGSGKVSGLVKPDSGWMKVVDIYGFAGNVYLLDEFKNQVWKYIATDQGLTPITAYLRPDASADFAAARNLQIDGAVWILRSEAKILKFVQGKPDFFQISGLDQPMDSIKSFYTADDTQNMYFLDSDHSRLVVTNKKGRYLSQYVGDKLKSADDLVVDEKNGQVYLLVANTIYGIDLR